MPAVTIIIPTWNRPNYLKRVLEYYSKFAVGYGIFEIIVADCSSSEIKQRNRETVASFPNLKIVHLNNFPEKISLYHEVADSLNHVKSKYCVTCADDDIVTPNGIRQAAEFLENNPDFIAAHGLYINFRFQDDRRKETRFRWRSIPFSAISFEGEDVRSRLEYHSSNLISTFFSVYRTESLQMIYQELLRSKVTAGNPIWGELFLSIISLVYGKFKSLPVLYSARDANSPSPDAKLPFYRMIEDGTYDGEYSLFRDYLAMHITKQSLMNRNEANALIDDTMALYLKKYDVPLVVTKSKRRQALENMHLPGFLEIGLAKAYIFLSILFVEPSSPLFPPVSENSEYPDDLDKIRSHVLAYAYSVYGKERFSERISRALRQI